jgi:hypothetical protein
LTPDRTSAARSGAAPWVLWGLTACLAFYLALNLTGLDRPALDDEEANRAKLILPVPEAWNPYRLETDVVYTETAYHASGKRLVLTPFLLAARPGPAAVRRLFIFAGAATILLTYAVGFLLFRRRSTALLAAALLAADPSFLVYSRVGAESGSLLVLLNLTAVFFALKYRDEPRPLHLFCACFAFAFGFSCNAWMIFPAGAFLLLGALTFRRNAGLLRRIAAPRPLAAAALGTVLGGYIFCRGILARLPDVFASLSSATRSYEGSLAPGRTAWGIFRDKVLGGDGPLWCLFAGPNSMSFFDPAPANVLWAAAAAAALLYGLFFARRRPDGRPAFFVAAYAALYILVSHVAFPSILGDWHILTLLPAPHLLVAFAAVTAAGAGPTRRLLGVAAATLLLGSNVSAAVDRRWRLAASHTDHIHFCPAIEDLARWARTRDPETVLVAGAWGFSNVIRYTSGRYMHWYTGPDALPLIIEAVASEIAARGAAYVIYHSPLHLESWSTDYATRAAVYAAARDRGWRVDAAARFSDDTGRETHLVERVRPAR